MTFQTLKKSVLGALFGLLLASSAQATNVLLFDDYVYAHNTWGSALTGYNVTTVLSDSAFNSQINLGTFDLVVVQFDNDFHSINLSDYVSAGGKLIYSNWMDENDSILGITSEISNKSVLSITNTLAQGLSSNEQNLLRKDYYTFSRVLEGGVSLASLGSGSGIVRTGSTIINGFLGETFAKASDETQLYKNEIKLLLAPVPEPDSYAMLLAGLGLMGFIARRRKEKRAA